MIDWTTTSGLRDQRGCRIPDDLYNEFLNLALAKTLSPHKTTAEVIERHSKSIYFTHQVRVEYLKELKDVYSKTNKDVDREKDFVAILKAMEDTNCFIKVEGREGYKGFKEVPENIYFHKNTKDQIKWTKSHIDRFAKHGFLHTDSTVQTSKESLDIELDLDENDEFVCNLRSRPIRRTDA